MFFYLPTLIRGGFVQHSFRGTWLIKPFFVNLLQIGLEMIPAFPYNCLRSWIISDICSFRQDLSERVPWIKGFMVLRLMHCSGLKMAELPDTIVFRRFLSFAFKKCDVQNLMILIISLARLKMCFHVWKFLFSYTLTASDLIWTLGNFKRLSFS